MKAIVKGKYLNQLVGAVSSTDRPEAVLRLYDDKWLVQVRGAANVIMAAMLIPDEQMEHYERNGYEKIGLPLSKLDTFVRDEDEDIKMWMESRTLWMEDESGAKAKIATIDPESVEGAMEGSIKTDYEVRIQSGIDLLTDFIERAEDIAGEDNYMIGCREEGLYLYMTGDNSTMREFYEWDDFEAHKIDWSINNIGEADDSLVPKKDKGIDVIMATDFTRSINELDDEAVISIANHHPMKIVYDKLGEENKSPVKVSYIQTPRIDGDWGTLPDEVLE